MQISDFARILHVIGYCVFCEEGLLMTTDIDI